MGWGCVDVDGGCVDAGVGCVDTGEGCVDAGEGCVDIAGVFANTFIRGVTLPVWN